MAEQAVRRAFLVAERHALARVLTPEGYRYPTAEDLQAIYDQPRPFFQRALWAEPFLGLVFWSRGEAMAAALRVWRHPARFAMYSERTGYFPEEGVVDLDPRLGLLGDEGGFYPEASYRLLTPLWRGIAGAPEGFEDLIRVVEVWEAEAEGNLEGYHTWASERFGLYRDLARFLEVR